MPRHPVAGVDCPFDRLFLHAEPAVLNQQHKRETPPVNGGRWPVSVVLFPEPTMALVLDQVMEEALPLAGPGHFHTGLAGSSHFTVRALEYYRDDVGPDDAEIVKYRRDIWYLDVPHFANDIAYPDRLVEWVKERSSSVRPWRC